MHSDTDKKLSHKGVSQKINLDDVHYLKCLYENDPGQVSYGFIQVSKKECLAQTRTVTKKALNGLYMKFHVEDNRVSVRPHMLNGEYL